MVGEGLDLSVNFEYYKIFYVVAKNLNITKASKKLFISQPAVTQTINKLEQTLGEKLFLRSNKGLKLTEFGLAVFEKVRGAVFLFSQISYDAQNFSELKEGSLIVGAGTHITKYVLSHPLKTFSNRFPNIKIFIKDDKKEQMLKQLFEGEFDLILTNNLSLDSTKFNFIPLFKDKRVFVASKEFISLNKGARFEDFAKNNFITISKGTSSRLEIEEIAKRKNVEFLPKLEVEGYSLVISLVRSGYGVGFLPSYFIKDEIESGELIVINLDEDIEEVEYGIVTNKTVSSKATQVFIDIILNNTKVI